MTTAGADWQAASDDFPPLLVINEPEPPAEPFRLRPLLVIGIALVFVLQLTVLAETGERGPTQVVDDFVNAFNEGNATAVGELLVDEPSIVSWPAGPPWGGVLQWTLELLPAGRTPRLTHSADLDQYVAYHHTLNGSIELEACREEARADGAIRQWIECRFVLANDLARLLEPDAPAGRGELRFSVVGNQIDAVVVESWQQPAPSGVGLLVWMNAQHPDTAGLLEGRVTVSDYRTETARSLLAFAEMFVRARA